MKKLLYIVLFVPLLVMAQEIQKDIVKTDYVNSGTETLTATKSITFLPQTILSASGSSYFEAKITNDPYYALNLSDENYVLTRSFQTETKTGEVSEGGHVIENITYFDGLGRAKQNIAIRQSPTRDDIVTHIAYDDLGRQDKEYLPYVVASNSGAIIEENSLIRGVAEATENFYKTKYSEDFSGVNLPTNAYSQKEFEASPLNRVLKQAAPGQDWALGGDHEIVFDYQANSDTDEIKLFEVTTELIDGIYEPSLIGGTSSYNSGELYKTITKDENHDRTDSKLHTTEEFKNKQGQVILKRTYALVNAIETKHDTYYIYDDYGNLTYVLPPKVTTADTDGVSTDELSELCYQYKYDERNRLVEKKIPGKGKEYIVYDNLDRPVFTQDANLRADKEWLFTKYDVLGRVIYTGIYTHISEASQAVMQTYFNSQNNTGTKFYETVSASAINAGGTLSYYSNANFPVDNTEILTQTYYNTYSVGLSTGSVVTITPNYQIPITTNTKGLPTVSKVKVLETDNWITTVTSYDDKARPVYVYSENEYLETIDITESKLDFVGKVLKIKMTHQKSGQEPIVTVDDFEYDHSGRLLAQKQKINSQSQEVIVENNYDDLGQLESKEVGGSLQKVDYTYNVRGWLKNINEDANDDNDLFNFSLKYNNPNSGTALYNGNISQTNWNSASLNTSGNPVSNEYVYSYDALNRITNATENTGNYNLQNVTYDKNGNIQTLLRKGLLDDSSNTFGTMDNLDYTYDSGNKLLSVNDDVTNTSAKGDFTDGNTAGDDYTYDVNGNMIADKNKGIRNITYNHLNLPTSVLINGSNIDYVYDATGVKLAKDAYVTGNGAITTQYAGNYIYEQAPASRGQAQPEPELQFFNHPEGYVKTDVTSNGVEMSYVYQYKDNLGNVRLSYTDVDKNGVIDPSTEIVEESNYYPFGLKHKGYNNVTSSLGNSTAQKFGYNGKELNEELGLEWHDFGARNYDASLGRWMNIDNASEEYYDFTPYSYVANSPLIATDPDGQRIVVIGTDDYRSKVYRDILALAKTKAGFDYLQKTINSDNTLIIQHGKGGNEVYERSYNKDGTYNQYLDYDVSNTGGNYKDGSVRSPETILAHEFDHFLSKRDGRSWPIYTGKTQTDDEFNVYKEDIKGSEPFGVEAGNKIRATYGGKLRKFYGVVNVYDKEPSKKEFGKLVPKAKKFNPSSHKGKFVDYPTVVKFLLGTKRTIVPPGNYSNKNTFHTSKKMKANVIEKK